MNPEGDRSGNEFAYCYRCGHLWIPKSESVPKRCPRCHSCRWNVPERRVRTCRFCGVQFRMDSLDDPCPKCGRRQDEPLNDWNLHCNRCDYEWRRRSEALPKTCPMCRSTDWNKPKEERLMCQQCGHVWRRQAERPAKCPKCQSRQWDRPSQAVRCQRCGHAWKMRGSRADGARTMCPRCKSRRWDEPMMISRESREGSIRYSGVSSRPQTVLLECGGCGNRWYIRDDGPAACPVCGLKVSYHDRMVSSSMVMWEDRWSSLMYTVENGCGCVYLWDGDYPVTCMYVHEALVDLGMTMAEVLDCVNRGERSDSFEGLAERMRSRRDEYRSRTEYFVKRLSLSPRDAEILAIHFTGMGPEAIARHFSMDEGDVRSAFDRIMDAYANSGIIVDDTIFTEDPFRYY